jgi:hypothetical protein
MVWLFVRIHMMNQNACLASCEDVLAALPTRATRDPMNGNHTAFFNPETAAARYGCGAISHKVSTQDLRTNHHMRTPTKTPVALFLEVVVIFLIFSSLASLAVLGPIIQSLVVENFQGARIPAVTQMIFTIRPTVIIVAALVLGIATAIGRLKSDNVWILRSAVMLTVLFAGIILIGLALPFLGQR